MTSTMRVRARAKLKVKTMEKLKKVRRKEMDQLINKETIWLDMRML